MMELYLKDIKVWIPDPVNVWQSASIVEDYKKGDKALKLITDDGQEKVLSINNPDTDLPHLRNPSILIGQNDLTALSYLHEPDVLHNLEVRFLGKQTIYTYCGIILVAINPYQDMPLYSLDIIRAYRGHNMGAATQIPSDTKDFEETLTSLKTLGFSTDSIRDIMHILAGILHLGNIRFVSNSTRNNAHGEHEDSCNISVNDLHLSVMCDLLQINKKDLRKWLITRQIDSYNEQHFSDTVQYESYGFVEKNRDHVSKELVGVLQMSDMAFCRQLMCLEETKTKKLDDSMSPTSGGQGRVVIKAKYATLSKQPQKKTVGSQFRESLSSLINTLSMTTSHYVRCIKPNEEKAPFKWEPQKIVQQLRACGVLETVRISAAGFPSRWSYERFYERYHLLCKQVDMISLDWNIQKISEKIVLNWIKDEERYRFGKTQIFFRAGQVAYLEQVRSDLRKRSIIIVQAHIRRFIYERKYQRLRKIAIGLQRFGRGWIARQKAKEKRQTRAAITIQRYFRGWIHRNRFLAIRRTILGIQTRARGLLVRRKFNVLLDNYKAIQIQRFCRGYLARQAFNKRKHSIIIVQSLVRRFLARRQLKKLKAEERTITHIQKMYKGLEQKIFELQQRNDVLIKENQGLKIQTREIPELKSKLDAMKSLESELNSTKVILIEKEEKLEILQSTLQKETDEKMDILQEKHKFEEKMQHDQELWLAEKEELCNKLEILQTEREDSPTAKRSKIMLNVDNNEIQNAYQKSVKDKENLENENAALKIEVKRLQYILTHPNELEVYSKSINTSNDDSLDSKRSSNLSDNQLYENHRDKVAHKDATSIILRLRKLLEEEKSKGETLRKEVGRFRDKSNSKITVADIIR
uniref:CSON007507 protein n=1 Tax=Culicoides sonorensis TaxID=179676 RepID=A0A336N0D5_CULSO